MEIDSLRTVRSQVARGSSGLLRPLSGWVFHPPWCVPPVAEGGRGALAGPVIVRFVEYMLRCSPEEFSAPEVARVRDYCS